MKKTIISLLVVAALFTAAVSMAADVDRTLDADKNANVFINNLAGEVEVSGWKQNRVQLSGEIGEDVEELIFERDGKDIIIKVKMPNKRRGNVKVTSYLKIKVPMNSSLEISTVSADITVDGVQGELDLQSVSGNIHAEAFAADIDAESVSGDVSIKGNGKDADWNLTSVSGNVRAENISGEVLAEVVTGRINVSGGSFDRVSLETVNGKIEFTGNLRRDGRLDAESVNGAIDVEFTGDVSARFDIESFNGGIHNCFGPKSERTRRHGPGKELSFIEGKGEGRVDIETLNGGIWICKK